MALASFFLVLFVLSLEKFLGREKKQGERFLWR